ncbi:DUF1634 domain-containing protein [Chitinophagaceae bacterium LB-8]|uniref:DUF1634 domain-containing protein n=1 Tax=Paraflavisolibacter caeni TaxID=2982496 RepID=A0A9X3BHB7_9BACT|nr:DUF1634 domain-containing protein [Paraflavisolibacter caeni]MCU7549307.1 DUF1634 domain-containing protein [Paraflavisolibacter caeni]
MKVIKQSIRDRDMETIMGKVLRFGVLASVTIVTIGGIVYLVQHGSQKPYYQQFVGEPRRFREIQKIMQTALQGRGRSVIQLGLLVLMATPLARIAFSIIGYILEKDFLYVVITLIVFSVIILSL